MQRCLRATEQRLGSLQVCLQFRADVGGDLRLHGVRGTAGDRRIQQRLQRLARRERLLRVQQLGEQARIGGSGGEQTLGQGADPARRGIERLWRVQMTLADDDGLVQQGDAERCRRATGRAGTRRRRIGADGGQQVLQRLARQRHLGGHRAAACAITVCTKRSFSRTGPVITNG